MYRDILVHLKSYEEWSPHIDAAIALAARSRAYLTGLFAEQNLAILKLLTGAPAGGADIIAKVQADADAASAAMRARFEAAILKRGVHGAFVAAEGRSNELISLYGRFHDLVVVEQTDESSDDQNWSSAEEAAVNCGRPTLIVPRHGRHEAACARILVAWNGSREATRALHAAMPLIEVAESVAVLQGRMREAMPSIVSAPGLDIAEYLRRHAKSVDVLGHDTPDASAAAAILDAADTHRSDLIVMGALGRRGLSQLILGGATARVLRATGVPVLAAH
jgi:nucleotide-binding universal stress UspA family protein